MTQTRTSNGNTAYVKMLRIDKRLNSMRLYVMIIIIIIIIIIMQK